MTATVVNGHAVIATEPAVSPLTGNANRARGTIYYKQIAKLLLDDGSEMYGCIHCNFVRDAANKVYPHLKKHKRPIQGSNGHGPAGDVLSMTVEQLLDRRRDASAYQEAIDRLTVDRDGWKQRARAAERDLKTIRSALGITQ